jgi:hypothetical protein
VRIGVDIDNVVLDWQNAWADEYQKWFDKYIPVDKLGVWDAALSATHFPDWDEFWHWFQAARIWDKMDYVPGAAGGLYQLQHLGHTFMFVTARPEHGEPSARQLATAWKVPVDFLNDTSKHLAKVNVWVDDSPAVLQNLANHNRKAIKLLRPWNQDAPATWVAEDWPQVIEILKGEI